jgi:hypothetical protein
LHGVLPGQRDHRIGRERARNLFEVDLGRDFNAEPSVACFELHNRNQLSGFTYSVASNVQSFAATPDLVRVVVTRSKDAAQ